MKNKLYEITPDVAINAVNDLLKWNDNPIQNFKDWLYEVNLEVDSVGGVKCGFHSLYIFFKQLEIDSKSDKTKFEAVNFLMAGWGEDTPRKLKNWLFETYLEIDDLPPSNKSGFVNIYYFLDTLEKDVNKEENQ